MKISTSTWTQTMHIKEKHLDTNTVTRPHRLQKLAQSVQAYVWAQPSWQRETESAPSLCSTELSLRPGLDWLSVDNHCALWMWTHTNVHTRGHNHAKTRTYKCECPMLVLTEQQPHSNMLRFKFKHACCRQTFLSFLRLHCRLETDEDESMIDEMRVSQVRHATTELSARYKLLTLTSSQVILQWGDRGDLWVHMGWRGNRNHSRYTRNVVGIHRNLRRQSTLCHLPSLIYCAKEQQHNKPSMQRDRCLVDTENAHGTNNK